MKKFIHIEVDCNDYKEVNTIYLSTYEKKYQLVGYELDKLKRKAVLTLVERKRDPA